MRQGCACRFIDDPTLKYSICLRYPLELRKDPHLPTALPSLQNSSLHLTAIEEFKALSAPCQASNEVSCSFSSTAAIDRPRNTVTYRDGRPQAPNRVRHLVQHRSRAIASVINADQNGPYV